MAAPRVSVLVPCFRSEAFLHRALDSLLAQRFQDWEALVVDNASDDGTHLVAQRYAAADPRIRAYRNAANLGPVLNWRRAAELAGAPLAALLFSDDWYAPDFLGEAVPLLAEPGTGFAYSAVRLVTDPAAAATSPIRYGLPGPLLRPTEEFVRASYGRTHGAAVPVSPGCAVFRTEDLRRWLALELPEPERYGWTSHGAGPDVAIYLQACAAYPRFGHLADPRVYFLSHASNLSWRPEVNRAYAVTLAWFLEGGLPGQPVGRKARTQLAARLSVLGEEGRSRETARGLGAFGRLLMFQERWLQQRAARRAAGARRT